MTPTQPTRITWLGHATVLVQTAKGTNILIDPFIAHNPKYPQNFELPSKIHYILLTHGHGDHISDAVPVAKKHGSTVVAVYELADFIAGKGVQETIGMNLGGTVQLDDVAATMVDAKHSSGAQDEKGVHYVGVAGGFVLEVAGGPVLYHAGDTCVFGDMQLIRELVQARGGHAAHRRLLHHGTEGSGARLPPPGAKGGPAHPLGHISAAHRHAGRTGRSG